MTALSGVTYTIQKTKKLEDGRLIVNATLSFGNGSLTYPTGGIPLIIGKLGMRAHLDSLVIDDDGGTGYVFVPDLTNLKLKLLESGAHTHDLLLKNAAVADGATTRVNAGANLLGANTGSDITVAGAGANGGLKNSTPAVLAEAANTVAPAAQSIRVTAIGF